MNISKETRIKVFIFVDVVFFLIEIIIGYTAHSLALVADAFHMLNDVISLCVGLWAVKVATNRSSSNEYTYGWARAEILGGLVNGVFLVALCLSIVLEAIQRFFEPQEVSNPKLVLIVGGIGLAFNILGLFVFHQHDHSHDEADEHEHAHGAHDELSHAEQGQGHSHSHGSSENTDKTAVDAHTHDHQASPRATAVKFQTPDATSGDPSDESASTQAQRAANTATKRFRRARSGSRGSLRAQSISDSSSIHPAYLRNNIISQARYNDEMSDSEGSDEEEEGERDHDHHGHGHEHESNGDPTEASPLLGRASFKSSSSSGKQKSQTKLTSQTGVVSSEAAIHGDPHKGHRHTQPRNKAAGGHGHSHADMNIRGMFLHVLGDALGNVGVMASALIIWLTSWSFRFYFDPLISLFITLIILKSAIPLCKETAKPLLQAAPTDVSVDDIIEDVKSLPGVANVHHLHVWSLTPSKRVATLHAQLDFNYDAEKYMEIAKEIKHCLRGFGIHSSTIQPEFQYSSLSDPSCKLDSVESGEEAMKCCTPPDGSGTATPLGNDNGSTSYGT